MGPADVVTNLGMPGRLRCRVPSTQMVAWLGTPDLYVGERGSLALAARLSGGSDAFVDIGAHMGYFTFFVRTHGPAGLPIHFFEPDPTLFARLDRNVRENGLPGVHGHQQAIGATDGVATFFVNETDSFSGSLLATFAEGYQVTPTDVEVTSFASIAARLPFQRACVKVDVEGCEGQFMDGAAGALDRIAYLIIEVLGPANARGFVKTMMARGGFRAYYVNDYTLEPSADGTFTYREPEFNWLFCRETPDELAQKLAGSPLRVQGGPR
jgi:FkbM family methyltransferase